MLEGDEERGWGRQVARRVVQDEVNCRCGESRREGGCGEKNDEDACDKVFRNPIPGSNMRNPSSSRGKREMKKKRYKHRS